MTLESVLRDFYAHDQNFAKVGSNEEGITLQVGKYLFVVKDNLASLDTAPPKGT